jgi:hypothetical protein
VAYPIAYFGWARYLAPKAKVTRSNRVGCAISNKCSLRQNFGAFSLRQHRISHSQKSCPAYRHRVLLTLSHRDIEHGEEPVHTTCHECSLKTYVLAENRCARCHASLGTCSICDDQLTPDNIDVDDHELCSYHGYVLSKDDQLPPRLQLDPAYVAHELASIQNRKSGLGVAFVRSGWPDWRHQPIEKITIKHLYLRSLHLSNKNRGSNATHQDDHEENFYRFIRHLDTFQRRAVSNERVTRVVDLRNCV